MFSSQRPIRSYVYSTSALPRPTTSTILARCPGSDESGRREACVQAFPTPESKYQVTTSGGYVGIWSKNGKEMLIFGLDRQRFIQVVPVGAAAPNSITVVINWMAGLEKK